MNNKQISFDYRPDSFLYIYAILFIASALISVLFLFIHEPDFSFAFGIITMGITCFLPLIAFRQGQWNGSLSPYSIIFAVDCICFVTLGLGAWNIPKSHYSYDISINSLAMAELVVALAQFFLNFSYIKAASNSYNKLILRELVAYSSGRGSTIATYDYKKFSLIIITLGITYVVMRLSVFSAISSTALILDSSLTGNPIYALGLSFTSIFPFIVCPATVLCIANQPSLRPWLYLVLLAVFLSILQSTLRREILCFLFTFISSLTFADKKFVKKITLAHLTIVPLTIAFSFLGFVFRQIKNTFNGLGFDSSSDFLTTIIPELYKTITNPLKLQLLWQQFIDNFLGRFLALDPIARILEKNIFTGGQATLHSFLGVIPRFIWTDKPATGGLDERIIIEALQTSLDTDRTATYQLQIISDFTILGLLLFSVVLGVTYAYVHHAYLKNLNNKFTSIYYFTILGIVMNVTFEGTLSTALVSVRNMIVGFLVIYCIECCFLRRKHIHQSY